MDLLSLPHAGAGAVASGVWWPGPGEPGSVRAQASWTTEPL
jgi:hypothetical protein